MVYKQVHVVQGTAYLTLCCIVVQEQLLDKNFDLKIRRDNEKNPMCAAYESVDDKSLSGNVSQKSLENRIHTAKC